MQDKHVAVCDDTLARSTAKAVSWRLISSITTAVVTALVTDSWSTAAKATAALVIVNTILYIIHDRVWGKVPWGKR